MCSTRDHHKKATNSSQLNSNPAKFAHHHHQTASKSSLKSYSNILLRNNHGGATNQMSGGLITNGFNFELNHATNGVGGGVNGTSATTNTTGSNQFQQYAIKRYTQPNENFKIGRSILMQLRCKNIIVIITLKNLVLIENFNLNFT